MSSVREGKETVAWSSFNDRTGRSVLHEGVRRLQRGMEDIYSFV